MRRPSAPREHLWSPPQISQGLALLTDFSFVLADSAIGSPFIVDYPCEKAVVHDISLYLCLLLLPAHQSLPSWPLLLVSWYPGSKASWLPTWQLAPFSARCYPHVVTCRHAESCRPSPPTRVPISPSRHRTTPASHSPIA